MKTEKELLEILENSLGEYDRIILVINDRASGNDLLSRLLGSEAIKKSVKKIMIMSCENREEEGNYTYFQISRQEEKWLNELYRMYEFSDRFQILSYGGNYGNIFNYVETGLMTMEEVFEAVLH